MERVSYGEWVSAGDLIKALMVMFSAVVVCVTVVLFLHGRTGVEDFLGLVFGWAILAFVLFLFWNYRGLEIKINSNKLSVKYGIFNRKSINFSHISSCRVIKASFGRYGGIGIRYGLDGSTAYTTSFGNAVEIVPIEGRIFVFSSNNPEKICNIIRTQKDE
jgi:hypothetical protein